MTKAIVLGLLSFCIFLAHIFIFHYCNIKRKFFAMIKVFGVGLVVYVILFFLVDESFLEQRIESFVPLSFFAFLIGGIIHFSFGYIYFYFIQIMDRSPSTRIMVDIEKSRNKRLSLDQIKEGYSIDRKIHDELDDMVILGRLEKAGDRYKITPKASFHVKAFKAIRNYLRLRRS